jgi:FtsH-binding integral membrane protein
MNGLIVLGVLLVLAYEVASFTNEKKAREALISVVCFILFFILLTWMTEDIAKFIWRY